MSIRLIVGLGNPGAKYSNTRHNAGAWLVEALAHSAHCSLRSESKFQGLYASTNLFDHECHLLVPTTYMNNSGQSVRALTNFYKIPPEDILVVHDELDLPAGIARLKFDGGAGGHNGLTDIFDHLHSKKFYRLRIGIGHPGKGKDVADFVLNPPSKSESIEIQQALQRCEEALPLILAGEIQKAMQKIHVV